MVGMQDVMMAARGWVDSSRFPGPVEADGNTAHTSQPMPSMSVSVRQMQRLSEVGRRRWAPRVDFK
eukprot:3539639-Pyramimonas_sp.AAC.1